MSQNYPDPYSAPDSSAPNAATPESEGYPGAAASEPASWAAGAGHTAAPQYAPQNSIPGQEPHVNQAVVYAQLRPTSPAAIWSLVLGVASLVICCGITAPFGLFAAAKGMKDTTLEGPYEGRGIAIAGLVTSIIGTLVLLSGIVVLAFYVLVGVFAMSMNAA
ncbi:MAG: DUF4190 domain-containing protein [Dermabacter sp.]|nr:DUF4190 domain-containing protein [Dermabacter sp.]